MRRVLAAAFAMVLLAGCGDTQQQRIAALNQFIGMSEDDLVRTIGVPSRTFEVGGHRFLAYVDSRLDVLPSPPLWGPWGFYGPYPGPFAPSQVIVRTCETTFEIVDGRVQSFSLRGNSC